MLEGGGAKKHAPWGDGARKEFQGGIEPPHPIIEGDFSIYTILYTLRTIRSFTSNYLYAKIRGASFFLHTYMYLQNLHIFYLLISLG